MQIRSLLVTLTIAAACAAPAQRGGEPAPSPDPWFAQGQAAVARAQRLQWRSGPARNVVLFLGDGMGVSTVTAARIFEGQLRGQAGEENLLSFEQLPHVALVKTYNTNQQVPESAGTMTAITTGVKTKAGVIGLDDRVRLGDHTTVAKSRVPTLFERAEARGLATGVVSTARVTHATPAACYAHAPHRDWEDDSALPEAARAADFPDIARQLLEFPHGAGDGLDVALGGGRRHFLPAGEGAIGRRNDGRDLTAEWAAAPDARYVTSRAELMKVEPGTRVLGLFSSSHMKWEVDRALAPEGQPSLADMTRKAIELLSANPRGFILMVEAARIDHGHHASNAYRALTETVELSQAVAVALEATDPDTTLVLVTADHGHVLSMTGYPTRGNPILGLVSGNNNTGEPDGEPDRDLLGLPFTTLQYANGPGYPGASGAQPEGPKHFPHFPTKAWPASGRPDLSGVDTREPGYLQASAVPLPVERHGGEDVAVYAGGPGAHLFHGVQEQSYLYHAIVAALGWSE